MDASEIKKSTGGSQHVRLIVPLDGKNVYFTETERTKSFEFGFDDMIKGVKKEFGKNADFLNDPSVLRAIKGLTDKVGVNLRDVKKKIDTNKISAIMSGITQGMKKSNIDDLDIEEVKDKVNTPTKIMALLEVLQRSGNMKMAEKNREENEIRDGIKQEKRNCAMSMVADMLGCGNVIAKSQNMNITVKENGEVKRVIKGVAMDEAIGDDYYKMSYKSDLYNKLTLQSLENNDRLTVQIADLQVLDYICGNSDRHNANIMYGFDDNGKLSIQGFDNDTSFIPITRGFDGFDGGNVGPGQMRIISKQTAEKIKNIKENDFRYMLYGFDLNTEEVDAAIKRLEVMRETIAKSEKHYENKKEGVIDQNIPRIVSDENIHKYSLTKTLAYKNGRSQNFFYSLAGNIKANKENGLYNNRSNLLGDGRMKLVGTGVVKMDTLSTRQTSLMHWYTTGSPQYTAVNNAVQDFKRFQADMKGDFFDKKNDKTASADLELKEMKQKLENLKELTKVYLDGKKNDKKKDKKGTRAWRRYNAIKEIDREVKSQLKAIKELEEGLELYNDIVKDNIKEPEPGNVKDINPGIKRNANGTLNIELGSSKKRTDNIVNDNEINTGVQAEKSDQDEVEILVEGMTDFYKESSTNDFHTPKDKVLFLDTLLKGNIASGLVKYEGMNVSEIEKNSEEYDEFKRAVGALVVKGALDGRFKPKKTQADKEMHSALRDICNLDQKLDQEKIDKMIEKVVETPQFEKMMDKLKADDKVFAENGSVMKYVAKAKKPFEQEWSKLVTPAFLNANKEVKNQKAL